MWLHGHPVSGGGVWMLGSQRRLRVAEVVSLYWGHWWGLFRRFLLALLSMALSYTGVFLSWVLTSILTQSLGSQGKGILWGLCIPEWQDPCQHNNSPCLYGHITCMTSTHLPLFQRLQQQANPVTTPKHTLSHLFRSWATRALGTQARAPSTISGMDKPPVLWAFRVWGTYLTAHVLYQTFPHLIMFMVGSSNPLPTHDFSSFGRQTPFWISFLILDLAECLRTIFLGYFLY